MHAIRTGAIVWFALIAGAGVVQAVEPPESLEAAINGSLQNHPEIVAAQAKITAARAEFDKVRLHVVGQIAASWGQLKNKREEVNQLKKRVAAEKDPIRQAEIEAALVLAQGEYEQMATELHYMTQFTGGQALNNHDQPAGAEPQVPHSQVARKTLEKIVKQPVTLEAIDVSLQDLLNLIRTQNGVNITIDVAGGVSPDMTFSINVAQVSLLSALQAIEDCSGLQFVMRNYGLLVTHPHVAQDKGYVPVGKYATDYLGIDLTTLEEEQENKADGK
ncbi:MAG: hypothetical protein JNM18_08765 [Planctomycetaceae bacterium]|nr:hypothetical protein [Planctomycetaceae bacterium]